MTLMVGSITWLTTLTFGVNAQEQADVSAVFTSAHTPTTQEFKRESTNPQAKSTLHAPNVASTKAQLSQAPLSSQAQSQAQLKAQAQAQTQSPSLTQSKIQTQTQSQKLSQAQAQLLSQSQPQLQPQIQPQSSQLALDGQVVGALPESQLALEENPAYGQLAFERQARNTFDLTQNVAPVVEPAVTPKTVLADTPDVTPEAVSAGITAGTPQAAKVVSKSTGAVMAGNAKIGDPLSENATFGEKDGSLADGDSAFDDRPEFVVAKKEAVDQVQSGRLYPQNFKQMQRTLSLNQLITQEQQWFKFKRCKICQTMYDVQFLACLAQPFAQATNSKVLANIRTPQELCLFFVQTLMHQTKLGNAFQESLDQALQINKSTAASTRQVLEVYKDVLKEQIYLDLTSYRRNLDYVDNESQRFGIKVRPDILPLGFARLHAPLILSPKSIELLSKVAAQRHSAKQAHFQAQVQPQSLFQASSLSALDQTYSQAQNQAQASGFPVSTQAQVSVLGKAYSSAQALAQPQPQAKHQTQIPYVQPVETDMLHSSALSQSATKQAEAKRVAQEQTNLADPTPNTQIEGVTEDKVEAKVEPEIEFETKVEAKAKEESGTGTGAETEAVSDFDADASAENILSQAHSSELARAQQPWSDHAIPNYMGNKFKAFKQSEGELIAATKNVERTFKAKAPGDEVNTVWIAPGQVIPPSESESSILIQEQAQVALALADPQLSKLLEVAHHPQNTQDSQVLHIPAKVLDHEPFDLVTLSSAQAKVQNHNQVQVQPEAKTQVLFPAQSQTQAYAQSQSQAQDRLQTQTQIPDQTQNLAGEQIPNGIVPDAETASVAVTTSTFDEVEASEGTYLELGLSARNTQPGGVWFDKELLHDLDRSALREQLSEQVKNLRSENLDKSYPGLTNRVALRQLIAQESEQNQQTRSIQAHKPIWGDESTPQLETKAQARMQAADVDEEALAQVDAQADPQAKTQSKIADPTEAEVKAEIEPETAKKAKLGAGIKAETLVNECGQAASEVASEEDSEAASKDIAEIEAELASDAVYEIESDEFEVAAESEADGSFTGNTASKLETYALNQNPLKSNSNSNSNSQSAQHASQSLDDFENETVQCRDGCNGQSMSGQDRHEAILSEQQLQAHMQQQHDLLIQQVKDGMAQDSIQMPLYQCLVMHDLITPFDADLFSSIVYQEPLRTTQQPNAQAAAQAAVRVKRDIARQHQNLGYDINAVLGQNASEWEPDAARSLQFRPIVSLTLPVQTPAQPNVNAPLAQNSAQAQAQNSVQAQATVQSQKATLGQAPEQAFAQGQAWAQGNGQLKSGFEHAGTHSSFLRNVLSASRPYSNEFEFWPHVAGNPWPLEMSGTNQVKKSGHLVENHNVSSQTLSSFLDERPSLPKYLPRQAIHLQSLRDYEKQYKPKPMFTFDSTGQIYTHAWMQNTTLIHNQRYRRKSLNQVWMNLLRPTPSSDTVNQSHLNAKCHDPGFTRTLSLLQSRVKPHQRQMDLDNSRSFWIAVYHMEWSEQLKTYEDAVFIQGTHDRPYAAPNLKQQKLALHDWAERFDTSYLVDEDADSFFTENQLTQIQNLSNLHQPRMSLQPAWFGDEFKFARISNELSDVNSQASNEVEHHGDIIPGSAQANELAAETGRAHVGAQAKSGERTQVRQTGALNRLAQFSSSVLADDNSVIKYSSVPPIHSKCALDSDVMLDLPDNEESANPIVNLIKVGKPQCVFSKQ